MFPAIERLFQLKSGVQGKCWWMHGTPFAVTDQAETITALLLLRSNYYLSYDFLT